MSPSDKQLMLASKDLVPMSQASKGTPYSTEYLSLLARTGKIKAIKISRDWLTTHAAVNIYLNRQYKKHNKAIKKFSNSLEKNIVSKREEAFV